MKKIILILTILYFCISNICSQNLSKMTISSCEANVPINICRDGKLGIIVFYSAIKDLEFDAISPSTGGNAIVNIEHIILDGSYILCVHPQEETNFSVKISANGFYPETYMVGSLGAKEKKCFVITTPDKTVEITVKGKDSIPLDNALIEITGKPTEHTNSVGYSKIELPNSEPTTLFISHALYDDKKTISVIPGEKRDVQLEQLKQMPPDTVIITPPVNPQPPITKEDTTFHSTQSQPSLPLQPVQKYLPLYFAVTAGASTFGSVSVGKISNGGPFVFGADLAYFIKSSWFGVGMKYNIGAVNVDFGNSVLYNETIQFVGPALYGRFGKNVAFTTSAGIGVLKWNWNESDSGNNGDYGDALNVGGFLSVGVNYMLTRNFGIGLNVQSVLGSLTDNYDNYVRNPAGIGATLGINFRF